MGLSAHKVATLTLEKIDMFGKSNEPAAGSINFVQSVVAQLTITHLQVKPSFYIVVGNLEKL